MLLKEIYEKKHYAFVDEPIDDWRDAIRACCKPLEADGTVEPIYAEEIVQCVEKHGPYIVLIPGVAMPHSTENATGCNGTAIGFMRVSEPVTLTRTTPRRTRRSSSRSAPPTSPSTSPTCSASTPSSPTTPSSRS